MTIPAPPLTAAGRQRKAYGPLEITALVTAFVVAPVGLVLGFVSVIRAHAGGFRASILSIIAIVLGAVLTVIAVFGIITAVVVVNSINSAADTKAFCARYASDTSVLNDVDALRPDIQSVTADYLPNHGPSEAERTDVAARAAKLASRLHTIALSSGHSYPQQWGDMSNVYDELSQLASDLRSNKVYSGEGAKPTTDETAAVRDEMTALCR